MDALDSVNTLMPWLTSQNQALFSSNSEISYWSGELLSRGAQVAAEQICSGARTDSGLLKLALTLFRMWAGHPSSKKPVPSRGPHNATAIGSSSRSTTWKAYYDVLTAILQNGLTYLPPTGAPERPQFASEIRRVESVCEANILNEVGFPKASSGSSRVESWVEQVVSNWEVLCGPNWRDEELGDGGQVGISRIVLDVSGSRCFTITPVCVCALTPH